MSGLYRGTIVPFVLLGLTTSAMVLPRPPSSPNHIRQEHEYAGRKIYEPKAMQTILQNTNVERPDTEDYRLLEIELQSADEMDAVNLQNIVQAMFKQRQTQAYNESHPHPEVVPHSILGVRDIGLTPNLRLDAFDDDKRVLIAPPKLQSANEKLYYLKNGKPKVYVNVRGRSGSFRKSVTKTTPNDSAVGFLRVTRPLERHTDWKTQKERKARPPKKYNRRMEDQRGEKAVKSIDFFRPALQASAYGPEDLSTTENSMVTSSELPKQIPAPPSKIPGRTLIVQTTPVQRYALRRTDILPGYSFSED